jgi:hypothetical protein
MDLHEVRKSDNEKLRIETGRNPWTSGLSTRKNEEILKSILGPHQTQHFAHNIAIKKTLHYGLARGKVI